MASERAWSIVKDSLEALSLVGKTSWRRSLHCWVYVPIGIFIVLIACFSVESLMRLSSVSFPASVACVIVLFFSLLVSERFLGDKATKKFISLLDIPCGFCLRWINVFFCPSFVVLPLSAPISGTNIGKIAGMFTIGYLVMFTLSTYFVRGLQFLFGVSKRSITERAEELGEQEDSIPLVNADVRHLETPHEPSNDFDSLSQSLNPGQREPLLQPPIRAQDRSLITGTGGPPEPERISHEDRSHAPLHHNFPPLTRTQRWAASLTRNLDAATYTLIFVLAGLPLYYATSFAMPAHLTLNILAYLTAIRLPTSWQRFLHPVLLASALTILTVYLLSLTHFSSLSAALRAYRTGARYPALLRGTNSPLPGAGDILGSAIDVSIVALALPMYQHRRSLRRHLLPLLAPNLLLALASLLAYPALGPPLSLPPRLALAFPARSLTLALATPATANLGGDVGLNAVLAIASGMVGALAGGWLLRVLRVPEDDYVTRGVVLGANSSAIATAALMAVDPRAGAFASLSMGLFGVALVVGTSVPVVARLVGKWAGL